MILFTSSHRIENVKHSSASGHASAACPSHKLKAHVHAIIPTHHTTGTRRSPRSYSPFIALANQDQGDLPRARRRLSPPRRGEIAFAAMLPSGHGCHPRTSLLRSANARHAACMPLCMTPNVASENARRALTSGCCSPGAPALEGLAAAPVSYCWVEYAVDSRAAGPGVGTDRQPYHHHARERSVQAGQLLVDKDGHCSESDFLADNCHSWEGATNRGPCRRETHT